MDLMIVNQTRKMREKNYRAGVPLVTVEQSLSTTIRGGPLRRLTPQTG
jgi:hypothetical protein